MRLITFALKWRPSKLLVGVDLPKQGQVVDLNKALGRPDLTMRTFIELGDKGLSQARAVSAAKSTTFRYSASDIVLKAPIFDTKKLICIGMNYKDHCIEVGAKIPTEPVVFNKFPESIISPGEPVVLGDTKELDWEVEMVIVIGKGGKDIRKEDWKDHVLGYTVAHDVSARDWQLKRNGGQWLLGKSMDAFCPLGPAIVTTDELGDPHNLGIRCSVNGVMKQDSNTRQMVFKTGDIVAWISRLITLSPGDVILTGTPPGVGCFAKPPQFLQAGDSVTVEIDGIGAITNPVVAATARL